MPSAVVNTNLVQLGAPQRSRPAGNKGRIAIDGVSVVFNGDTTAVEQTTLALAPGEFVCVLGPSGCGKSTLLNCVAGYLKPSAGQITLDDKPIKKPGPERGMVFQQYSLFPWKTIRDNVAFGPRQAGVNAREASSIANTFLGLVGLSNAADKYPGELSGGMQQRAGIARALANYPSVLLMDEPFGALDAQTRTMMQDNLLKLWAEFHTTVMFVTHDIDEAVFLADRVVIMSASPGRIIADLKVGLPRPRSPEVYTDSEFVALKRECMGHIRAESLKAFEQQQYA